MSQALTPHSHTNVELILTRCAVEPSVPLFKCLVDISNVLVSLSLEQTFEHRDMLQLVHALMPEETRDPQLQSQV